MKMIQCFYIKYSFVLICIVLSSSVLSSARNADKPDNGLSHTLVKKKAPKKEAAQTQEPKEAYSLRGIALFAGQEPFSAAIRKITHSKFSHVGIILTKEDVDPDDQSHWVCFEATGSANEILRKHVMPHTRMTPWNDLVSHYGGGIWVRTFQFDDTKIPSSAAVTDFVHEFDGRPYEKNMLELIRAARGKNKTANLNAVFCSELVAEMLMQLELMEPANSNNFTPKQFSSEKPVKLIGANLSEETVVKVKKNKLLGVI